MRARLIIALGIAAVAMLSACDDSLDVTREYPSTLSKAAYLQGLPDLVPVHLDAVPPALTLPVQKTLQVIAAELSAGTPVRFAFGDVPDGRQFALRIALQPSKGLSALTLCQGRSIGRPDSPQRSLVVVAAVCHDRQRLGEVRAVQALQGNGTGMTAPDVIDAAVRKLFALPAQ